MNKKFLASIVVFVAYVLVIIVGQKLQVGTENVSLNDLAGKQILISLVVGLIFLIAVTFFFGWRREVGIVPPRTVKSLFLAWLPALFIGCFFLLGALIGFPPRQTLLFVGMNTLLVGISEELAFRRGLDVSCPRCYADFEQPELGFDGYGRRPRAARGHFQ